MRLTSKGRYAICALLDMANHMNGSPMNLREISGRQNIPLNYLEQIFRKLRISGIVHSIRGPGGGYIFGKEIRNVTIDEVLISVEDEIKHEEARGSKEQVATAQFLDDTDLLFKNEFLTKTTLGILLDQSNGKSS